MRYVQVWTCAREHLEWLVEHAVDGWLVPPDAGQRRWLDAINRRLSSACAEAGWPEHQRGHWLRHHYATYSLTTAPVGYGFDIWEVSRWLGHSSTKVTSDLYWHAISGADQRALAITARPLG